MKRLTIGLTATAIITLGVFAFSGCEKDEVSQNEFTKQTTEQNICLATVEENYDIPLLVTLPEFDSYAHLVSNMLGGFVYNVETNAPFSTQINTLCQVIMETTNPDVINNNYSNLVQMVFPTDYLNVTTNNGVIYYSVHTDSLNSLNVSYQNLISSIDSIYPGFLGIPEETKQQILAQMFVKRFFEDENNIGGPLEDERDRKLAHALKKYLGTFEQWPIPFLFAWQTHLYCEEVNMIWREYWEKGGQESAGKSYRICNC